MLSSVLHKAEVHFRLDLHPSRLDNVVNGVKDELSRHLMKYHEDLDGVVLSISDPQLLTHKAVIHPYFPYCTVTAKAQVVLFAATKGDFLVGRVNHCGEDFLGVIVFNLFQCSIAKADIRPALKCSKQDGQFTWRSTASKKPAHVIKIGTWVRFQVERLGPEGVHVSITGSLMDPATGDIQHAHRQLHRQQQKAAGESGVGAEQEGAAGAPAKAKKKKKRQRSGGDGEAGGAEDASTASAHKKKKRHTTQPPVASAAPVANGGAHPAGSRAAACEAAAGGPGREQRDRRDGSRPSASPGVNGTAQTAAAHSGQGVGAATGGTAGTIPGPSKPRKHKSKPANSGGGDAGGPGTAATADGLPNTKSNKPGKAGLAGAGQGGVDGRGKPGSIPQPKRGHGGSSVQPGVSDCGKPQEGAKAKSQKSKRQKTAVH